MTSDALERDVYADVVERLLFLPTELEIEGALAAMPGLNAALLDAAFAERAEGLAAAGLGPELELVEHVRALMRKALRLDAHTAPVDSRETLLDAAIAADDVLNAFFVLRQHAELVDRALFDRLYERVGADAMRRGPHPAGVFALCALGALLDDGYAEANKNLFWGSVLRRRGLLAKAARRFSRGAETAARIDDKTLIVGAAGAEASLAEARGDLQTAARDLATVLELSEREENLPAAIAARDALARVLRGLGRSADSLAVLDDLIELTQDLLPPDRLVGIRRDRALVLDDLGRYDEGEAEYARARALAASIGRRDEEFLLMTDVAASALKRGDSAEGVRRMLEILREVERWANPSLVAAARNNLGNAYLEAGRPADARREFGLAWPVRSSVGDKQGETISLVGLGDALRELGNNEGAELFYTMALIPYYETGDLEIIASVAPRLAGVALEDSNLSLLEMALSQARASAHLRSEASLSTALALQAQRRGDEARAEEVLRETLARATEVDADAPEAARLKVQLAKLLAQRPSSRPEAHALLASVVESVLHRVDQARLDDRRGELVAEWIDAFAARIDLLLTGGADLDVAVPAADAFAVHEAAKGRTFVAALADSAVPIPESVPEELRLREERLLMLEQALQRPASADGRPLSYRLRRLDEIGTKLEDCWAAIADFAPEYVRLRRGEPTTVAELRSLIASAATVPAALVSFFSGPDSTAVFVIRSDDDDLRGFRVDVDRAALEQAAVEVRRAFNGDPGAFPPVPPIRRERPEARPLTDFEALAEPLLAFLPVVDGIELLCLAPHGPLHALPLHALPLPDGGVLADRHAVVYCPSASTLAYSLAREAPVGPAAYSLAIAGVASADDAHPEFFERDAELFDTPGRVFEEHPGTAATKAAVAARLRDRDVVHVTCHGYFDVRDPLGSGLLLSDGYVRPPRQPGSISIAERSRFVLTAREILSSRTKARLVALRACATGVQAERHRGDELDGLTRSLIYAGSGAVLVSLWNVDQRSSRELIARFYRYWLGDASEPPWRALWLAQRELRQATDEPYLAHPYHWAPLVLTGDWR